MQQQRQNKLPHLQNEPQKQPKIVFTYFYVNGVNTPRTNNSWRGSCLAERNLVAQNLLGLPAMSGPPAPKQNPAIYPGG